MRPLTEQEYQKMLDERAVLLPALNDPAVQMLFAKLKAESDNCLANLRKVNVINDQYKAIYYQCYLDLVDGEIPRIIENIINVEQPVKKWSFRKWLADVMQARKESNKC